ncbi:MAG: PH domain-containing protein, partial [Myxococcota bacterium]|nr:PH domain-containing protein [Myxococcota bacterium]
LSLPLLVLVVRRRAYRIESDRIVYSSGILYRHQATVLFDRIDTIRHNQGALNKLFGNGNVTIMTAGSSAPDLVLRNLPSYLRFHQSIQERYRARH